MNFQFNNFQKVLLALILFFSFFGMAKSSQAATTYYISPSGNDNNSGSISAPFETIQKAADVVNPGDMVIVKNGVYTDTNNDGYVIDCNRGGNVSQPVIFKSEHKYGAIIKGQPYSTFVDLVVSAPYIIIDGFEITGGGHTAGIDNTNVTFIHNKIRDIGRMATNTAYGQGEIYVSPTGTNLKIDSNIFYNIGRLNPYTTPPAPESSCNLNHACYNSDHALYLQGDKVTIVNNIFYEEIKSGWAIQLDGGSSNPTGLQNIAIMNNTFYGQNPMRNGNILAWFDVENLKIYNNVFYQPKNHAIEVYESGGYGYTDGPYDFRNNIVYNAPMISSTAPVKAGVLTMLNNKEYTDPKFINPSTNDFHLQSTSPAINAGLSANAPAYDFDGNLRDGNPDIGAYEYVFGGGDIISPAAPSGLMV